MEVFVTRSAYIGTTLQWKILVVHLVVQEGEMSTNEMWTRKDKSHSLLQKGSNNLPK